MFPNMSIIGGADTPTALLLISRLFQGWGFVNFAFTLAAMVAVVVLMPNLMKEHLTRKTTVLSLCISAAGGAGLACFLWWLTLGLGGPKRYPVAYPVSMAGGFMALLAFVGLCIGYVYQRKKHPSRLGVVVEVVMSLVFLPLFTLAVMLFVSILQSTL